MLEMRREVRDGVEGREGSGYHATVQVSLHREKRNHWVFLVNGQKVEEKRDIELEAFLDIVERRLEQPVTVYVPWSGGHTYMPFRSAGARNGAPAQTGPEKRLAPEVVPYPLSPPTGAAS